MTAPVIDAHHHFWDPARASYPWMTDDLAAINRRFGAEDLAPLLARNGIDRTILVQARHSLAETRELLKTAAATSFVAGVVGWVDLEEPHVSQALTDLAHEPGGQYLVAIRHQVHDEPDPDWLARPQVRRGLSAVAAAGLAYDLLVRPRELPAALDVARSLPGLRLVVDHLAKPAIRDGVTEPWASRLRPFGELPNVWCKLSGLVTEADWRAWRPDQLRPYVEVAADIFGPARLLFGSDWPVCLLAAPYDDVIAVTHQLTREWSVDERADVFGRAAMSAYRLPAI